ncbi:LOW QUALITY PROTEIN: beta-1,3-N-acetylglucosaminyltransferase radical fringe [Alosa sapidissima]|uniref:LOW QUALITY PROTEIN: beta-1,3-N-acetylglucosaminyltransferase radical fringe n=1 Tax=Alosa sapidissima TaxID=34773 RepID=UPI001C09800F|nr:LOW QUALITY PROTEIN: beta-1,3-N-acetylglucosaminyltransferase radical fringe [Alosa sapidissima]
MHLSHIGINKLCFLVSLALCAFLLLLIPTLQAPPRQGDRLPPPPRPHTKPASAAGRLPSGGSARSNKTTVAHRVTLDESQQTRKESAGAEIRSLKGDAGAAAAAAAAQRRYSGSRSRDPLEPKDIFIAIKTTKKYHKTRLELLFQTWVSRAKEQTFIFTDGEDKELRKKPGLNMINTNCSAAHTRQALCCKMSVEYDKFIESQKKWFCHVDDDNYVILPSLLRLLASYSHTQDVYLGRPSLDHPIEAAERVKSDGSVSVKFWFATGGAGFCISRGLALKMSPWASLGNFITTAEKIRLPDDCTIGYIIEALLEVSMTHTHLFHSHLENLQRLPSNTVLDQVTLSYGGFENRRNVVSVGGIFSLAEDPSRFKTIHCLLYPETEWCPKKSRP